MRTAFGGWQNLCLFLAKTYICLQIGCMAQYCVNLAQLLMQNFIWSSEQPHCFFTTSKSCMALVNTHSKTMASSLGCHFLQLYYACKLEDHLATAWGIIHAFKCLDLKVGTPGLPTGRAGFVTIQRRVDLCLSRFCSENLLCSYASSYWLLCSGLSIIMLH